MEEEKKQGVMKVKSKNRGKKAIPFLLIGLILGSCFTFLPTFLLTSQVYAYNPYQDWKVDIDDWAFLQVTYSDPNWESEPIGNNIFWYVVAINVSSNPSREDPYGQLYNGSMVWCRAIDIASNGTVYDDRISWQGVYNDTGPFPFGLKYWVGDGGFFIAPVDFMEFYNFLVVMGYYGLGMNSSQIQVNSTHFNITLWNGTASLEGIYDTDLRWDFLFNLTKNTLEVLNRYHWNSSTSVWDVTFIGHIFHYSWRNYYVL